MAIKIKQGTNMVLPVRIDDRDFENITGIEFIFKQEPHCHGAIKTAYWSADGISRDAQRKSGERVILVRFSRSDTYRFKPNALFYMDTRIHYNESEDNPYTPVIAMRMTESLFEEDEEVGTGA